MATEVRNLEYKNAMEDRTEYSVLSGWRTWGDETDTEISDFADVEAFEYTHATWYFDIEPRITLKDRDVPTTGGT